MGGKKKIAGVLIFAVAAMCMLCGCIDTEHESPDSAPIPTPTLVPSPQPTITPAPTPIPTTVPKSSPSLTKKNIQKVREIAEKYYETHTYMDNETWDCSDMAMDVWNMLETAGINAVIIAGNTENPYVDQKDYDHAWVLAEVAPGQWLAVETTGGYVTYNQNYYYGFSFSNAREFKDYEETFRCLNQLYEEEERLVDLHNELVTVFNQKYSGRYLYGEEWENACIFKGKLDMLKELVSQLDESIQELEEKLQNHPRTRYVIVKNQEVM